MMRWKQGLVAFSSGAMMAASLVAGHVTDPQMIIRFLDVFGDWDPALVFYMAGCVVPYYFFNRAARRRARAALGGQMCIPTNNKVDARLVGGAAVFGVGWGMVGVCPGPALASVATGGLSVLGFVAAIAAGMYTYELILRSGVRRASRSAA